MSNQNNPSKQRAGAVTVRLSGRMPLRHAATLPNRCDAIDRRALATRSSCRRLGQRLGAAPVRAHPLPCSSVFKISIGKGKTMVEFFSLAISLSVPR
jgi:hypothetical protein